MAKPWEKYQQSAAPAESAGPWSKYADAPPIETPKAKTAEPGFGSRLYDQTIGGLVKLGGEVIDRTAKKKGPYAGLEALGEVVGETAGGLGEAYKKQPGTNPYARALGVVLGPPVETAITDAKNENWAALAGDVTAAGANIFGPKAVRAVGGKTAKIGEAGARRLMQSSLKPTVSDARTLGDVRAVTETALEEAIPTSESGMEKAATIGNARRVAVDATLAKRAGATVDPAAAASRVDQIQPRFANQVNPAADIKDIGAVKDEFLSAHGSVPLPIEKAQAIKQGTYRNIGDRAYGAESTARVEAQKAIARGLKEEMEALAPELAGQNKQLGAILDLEKVLERTVRRGGNADVVDTGDAITGAATAITGSPLVATVGLFRKTLGNPAIKSRLAIALYQGSRASGKPLSYVQATQRAGTIINTLLERSDDNSQEQP